MIRNADLFSVATSGLRASNRLLDTTANNIANVNTEGYVRERTSFGSELTGGVGRGTTERVINTFAQNQAAARHYAGRRARNLRATRVGTRQRFCR